MEKNDQLDGLELHLCVNVRMMLPMNRNSPMHVPFEVTLSPALRTLRSSLLHVSMPDFGVEAIESPTAPLTEEIPS